MARLPVLLTMLACAAPALAHEGLQCSLQAPARAEAGAALPLRFTLTNAGAAAVWVLTWNTPFERQGWLAPYVELTRDGVPVRYQGPAMKRGEPSAEHYLRLEPGASRTAEVDLALPFDLSRPGRYRVQPRLQLHDVAGAAARVPRPRSAHTGRRLPCNAVEFDLVAAAGRG
ncbi:MAG: protease [Pseudomonadota bacterium]